MLEPQAVGASKSHHFSLRYALLASASQSTHNPSLAITVLSGKRRTIESRGGRAQRIAGLVALQSGVFCSLRKGVDCNLGGFPDSSNAVKTLVPGITGSGASVSDIPNSRT